MTRPLVLLDVDGVLADFVGRTIEAAHAHSARRWRVEDFKTWAFFNELADPDVPDLVARVKEDIARPGFCESIRPLPGAVEGVERLRELARIKVVTSPWSSATWCSERYAFLKRYFGLDRADVVMASDKANIHGDFLVDDSPENVAAWMSYQAFHAVRPGMGLLWDTHFNRADATPGTVRVVDWEDLLGWVKA